MGQSRPSGGMQGSSSQQGMGSMGQSGQMANHDQRRQTMHTTQQQDKKYASCVQAMNKVRTGIKHMSGTTAGQTFDAQQADDGSGQLDTDVQDLEQDQNEFLDSLNEDQKTVLESQIKDVQKKMKQLDTWSKELKAELDNKNADPVKVREQVRKMDKLSKDIQKEQHQIADALGIQS